MDRFQNILVALIATGLATATLTGCSNALQTDDTSNSRGYSTVPGGKADSFEDSVVPGETRVNDAPVWRFHLTDTGLALEQVRTIEQSDTRVTIGAISEPHGLALVSEIGHVMQLDDLQISDSARDRLQNQQDPSSGWGETWREAPRYAVDDVTSEQVTYETSSSRESGVAVPVEAFAPSAEHGTWFVSEFGEEIVLMDARHVVFDEQKTVDAHYYEDRIWMAQKLTEAFPHHKGVPDDHAWAAHPHGAIVVQTRWQHRTGRGFADAHGRGSKWWWSDNYALSVWPFLIGQSEFEVFEDVRVIELQGEKYQYDEESREMWTEYFAFLRDNPGVEDPSYREEDDLEEKARDSQELFWEAHMHSIRVAQDRNDSLLEQLPEAERKMAESWGQTVVRYLSTVNFPTDEVVTSFFNGMLPQEVLTGSTFAGNDHLNARQLTLLNTLYQLHRHESRLGYPLLTKLKLDVSVLSIWGGDEYAFQAARKLLFADYDSERAHGNIVDTLQEILEDEE